MTTLVILHIEIDDAQPLGPQLVAARARGVPWKILAEALGRSRQRLQYFAAMARGPAEKAGAGNYATAEAERAPAYCARSAG